MSRLTGGIPFAEAQEGEIQPFQTIATNGASDWKFFTIDSDHFLVVANASDSEGDEVDSVIYRWDGTGFVEFQSVPGNSSNDWVFFTIGDDHYLGVTNPLETTKKINSEIYKWDGATFSEFQSVPTIAGSDWEFFTIDSDHFLAVANFEDDKEENPDGEDIFHREIDSEIYKWDGIQFAEFQSLATIGATDWKYFSIEGSHYLAVANAVDSNGNNNISSEIYKWNGTSFVAFQSIPTNGGSDWEFFTIDGSHYLAIANFLRSTGGAPISVIDSKIYKWNGSTFSEFQAIPTAGANDWEFFTIGDDHYLAVANNFRLDNAPPVFSINSALYKWNGTDFEAYESFATSGAFDWEFFTIDGNHFLAVANNRDNAGDRTISSKIYKWMYPPVLEDQSFAINENSDEFASVGTVIASDLNSDPLEYSITQGNTGSVFVINTFTGEITVRDPDKLDHESIGKYSLTVEVSDGTGYTATATITVNVNNLNDNAPTISPQTFSVTENSENGTLVGKVLASDPDADALTYSITAGNTDSVFAIQAGTGQITVNDKGKLDHENISSYALTVWVSDGLNEDSATITVNVSNLNDNPPTMADQSFSIDENSPDDTVAGTLTANDPDDSALTYTITDGNTGNAFAVGSSGTLLVSDVSQLDHEATETYELTLQVSDGISTDTATVTLTINDVNEAPVVKDQAFSVDDDSVNGDPVGTVLAGDPDSEYTLTYSITDGNTDEVFAISETTGEITVKDADLVDYKIASKYTLTVQVSDEGELDDTATVTVNIRDVDESPKVEEGQVFSVAESSGNGTLVGTVLATDPNIDDTLSYSIIAGNTGSTFAIDSTSGELTVKNAGSLDYETANSYELTVQASDGVYVNAAIVTVNLGNENEPPAVEDDNQIFDLDENSPNGTFVGTVAVNDPDGDVLTFTIIRGITANAFNSLSIGENTGELTVRDATLIDYEASTSFSIYVRVSDGVSSQDIRVGVNLKDTNDPPVLADQAFSVAENSENGDPVGTVTASDPDKIHTLTYSLLADNASGTFAISSTGKITVADAGQLNYEAVTSYTLTAEVSDGEYTDTATISVSIHYAGESPVVETQTFFLDGSSPDNTVVGAVLAEDPNESDVLAYEIIWGNSGKLFEIDSETGELTLKDASRLDENVSSYPLTIRVSDGTYMDAAIITVDIYSVIPGDVNDDGAVNLTDALLLLQILAGKDDVEDVINAEADVSGGGKLGILELVYILDKIVQSE